MQIAKVLLHNISAWNKTGGPILVVCFTNHALDQFLEGIHSFHPDGIVRVGGRSKSETIQECSLSKLKDDMTKVTYTKLSLFGSQLETDVIILNYAQLRQVTEALSYLVFINMS